MKSFLARIIEVPEELSTLVTAWIVAGFLWLEMYILEAAKIDLNGLLVAVGLALAAALTFVVHAALERWVPLAYHGIVNSVLKWLAALLTGGAVLLKVLL